MKHVITDEMRDLGLNPQHPDLEKKSATPSDEFRKKMDAQVQQWIQDDAQKQSRWLTWYVRKFRIAWIGVMWLLILWIATFFFTNLSWPSWTPSTEVAERPKFESSLARQIQEKKLYAAKAPVLLTYQSKRDFQKKKHLRRPSLLKNNW